MSAGQWRERFLHEANKVRLRDVDARVWLDRNGLLGFVQVLL